ncbi:MAG: ATP-binding protein [Chloroflexota bacterium]|nr:ATP-binding protein [Chloroflexota bacterium]
MGDENAGLAIKELGLLRWLRRYVRLRWLAVGAVLVGMLAARFVLEVDVPLIPLLGLTTVIAFYNALFSVWQQRSHTLSHASTELQVSPTAALAWGRRFAFAQVVADLIALTVLLHFVGGIETPFFLFYLFHVGFGSIMLSRRDAYAVMALAIGLFVLLVWAEFLGWLPHVHLEGFVSPGLYREQAYVAAVLVSFAATLVVLTVGATAIVAELRGQWERQAQVKERELEVTAERLAELDRMRAFFLGLASHDLKTPLAVVASYLQTILDGFVGEVNQKQRHWMERANTRVLELVRLIDDFLDVSQLAPERILDEMEQMLLSDTVQQSVEDVRVRAKERDVTLRVVLPRQLPPVYAAPRRLQQVITSLLDNAVKFSPRQGEVVLEAHQQDDGIRVDVVDMGPGIPTLYMPHIFEDYFRARRKEFVPGAGLGLSTARKIVETHGGEIWVESPCFEDAQERKYGSRFSFVLPRGQRDGEGSE